MKQTIWNCCWLGLAFTLVATSVSGDVVILKDGYVLEGKVRRESVTEFDPTSKEPFVLPKGFFMVETITKRIIFSANNVRSTEKKNLPSEEIYNNSRTVYIPQPRPLPPVGGIADPGQWDAKWDRDIKIFAPNIGTIPVRQHMQFLGSKHIQVFATKTFAWGSSYLTKELDKKSIEELIASHPDSQKILEPGSPQSFNRHQKRALFYLQAGMLEDAVEWLNEALKEFEGNRELSDKLLDVRKKAYEEMQHEKVLLARDLIAEGYLGATPNLLGSVVESQCAESDLVELRSIKAKTEKELNLQKEIRSALVDILPDPKASDTPALGREVLENIAKLQTTNDNAKFEPFLSQYRQWKKQDKKSPSTNQEKLTALAVSGWLGGASGADPSPTQAKRLWSLREQLQIALGDLNKKRSLEGVKELLKRFPEATTVDDVGILLGTLGPEEPDPAPPLFPGSPTKRVFESTHGLPGGTYLVQVPPHYDPAMPMPLLIVLHAAGEAPAEAIARWRDHAAKEGYILAVPTWNEPPDPAAYQFSVKEHEILLAALRDLRMRYRVDSDRVFLSGHFQGGQMAFDIGLSHPDLFAGVIPISASPKYYPEKYWRNGVYLPFYVVSGDRIGEINGQLKDLFNNWAGRSYSAIWVQYKGRGMEWFRAELPSMFAWMKGKKRVFPLKQLGADGNGGTFGNEFRTLRPTDSRFYWVEIQELMAKNSTPPPPGFDARINPATLYARTEPEKNEVFIKTTGIKKMALELFRNSKGECCLNLDKPVTVRWNQAQVVRNHKIKIDLEMMLADQAKWQDRQRFLVARVEMGNQ